MRPRRPAGVRAGGIAAQGAAGNYWNGPYGYGHYLSRFLLPDNGVTNWDGNHLRGNFYSFQVGTVKFISLDADDVIYQDGGSAYLNAVPNAAAETTTSGAAIPNGTVTYNHGYTGDLKIVPASNSAVPDPANGTPNLQTPWLERTLAQARRDRGVDMIVVFMHQCAMSTSVPGNGSDLGIRRPGAHGTVVSPNPDQTAGETIGTRRPSVATTETVSYYGVPAWDTSQGTVFLVLGGGGTNGPSNVYGTDAADGLPQAKVISERNAITGSQAAGFRRNAADSIEDAPWSAATNAGDADGYAVFDVDPGVRPGDTTITMKYFAIPAVSNETGSAHDGTTTLPTTPFETFVFGRGIAHGHHSGSRGARTLEGSRAG